MPELIEIDPPKKALNLEAHAEAVAKAAAVAAEQETPKPASTAFPSPLADAYNKARASKDAKTAAVEAKAKPESKPDSKLDTAPPADADDIKEPKKSEDWKKLHARVKEAETKAANLGKDLAAKLAELEAAKSQPVIDPKEVETLKTERDSLMSKLEVVALDQSDRFSKHFAGLFSQATATAKESVGAEHADQVEHLMQLPPSKARKEALSTILAGLENELDRTNLALAIQQMDRARTDRDEQLKNAKENLKKLRAVEEQEATERKTKSKAQVEAMIGNILNGAADEYEAFKLIEGNDEHNKAIEDRKLKVRKFLTGELDKETALKVPLLAEEALHYRPIVAQLRKDKADLEATIAKMTSAEPGGGTVQKPSKGNQEKPGFIDTFMEKRGPGAVPKR